MLEIVLNLAIATERIFMQEFWFSFLFITGMFSMLIINSLFCFLVKDK